MTAPFRKGWCPGALRPMEAKDGLLARLRLTGGILPAAAACAIADLAERYGNGLFDLTVRANLQMRGVRQATLPALQESLHTLRLLDPTADAEAVRNVIASPLAGLHNGPDIRPLVAQLERQLVQDQALHALPGKFGFLIDDGSRPSLVDVEADIRFDWDGEGFAIGLGARHGEALRIGRCDGSELVDEAVRIAGVFLDLSKRMPDVRRMRDLAIRLGPDGLSRACQQAINCRAHQPTSADDDAPPSQERKTDGVRAIVGWQRVHGVDCLGLAAPFGRMNAAMLRAAARLAEQTVRAELRLTPFRVMLVPGTTRNAALPGFIIDPADPRLSIAACVGMAGCARGTTDTHADATEMAGTIPLHPGITLHVSGCEKGCAKASATAITLVARDGRYDLVRDGRASGEPTLRNLDLAMARHAIAAELEPA